jgi:hypothetical protein
MHTTHALGHLRPGRCRLTAAALAMAFCIAALGAIAGTAVAAPLPPDWVAQGSGTFTTRTDPNDFLSYRVERNAVSQSIAQFRLEDLNRCHWWKELVMPDGLGSEWPLRTDASAGITSATNSLWADQVHNGQLLRFYKAGFFGFSRWVMNVGIDAVPPGSRVVFRWLRDSPGC